MNVRYLAGLACPACGASGTFIIDVTAPMTMCDTLIDHIDTDSLGWNDDAVVLGAKEDDSVCLDAQIAKRKEVDPMVVST